MKVASIAADHRPTTWTLDDGIRLHILHNMAHDRVIELLRLQALWVVLPSFFDDASECRLSCRGLVPLRHVHLTLYHLLVKLGVSVLKIGKEVGGVTSFAHHSFLRGSAYWPVLLTGDWHTFLISRETKVHPLRQAFLLRRITSQ